jgi:D-alanyl-D-alanine carboxypeptidase (penicillin-binding protein 5/6)
MTLSKLYIKVFTALIFFTALPVSAKVSFIPAAPELSAKAFVLMDYNSGEILASKNAQVSLPPASLTKMMTAYIIDYEIEQGNIAATDVVTVSENAWAKNFPESSKMFIEPGKKVTVEQLHKGIVIQSGNDASVAIAEHIAGAEDAFAQLMNSHAKQMGLNDTHFVNSMGLPAPEHYTTALDMAKLARAVIADYPESYKIYSQKEYKYNGISQLNRNRLLWDKSLNVDGLKTGHTKEAGYCLVTSAQKNKMRLIAVVMGTASEQARKQESKKLLNWGFRFFRTVSPLEAGKSLHKIKVYYGTEEQLDVGIVSPVHLTIPKNKVKDLKAEFVSKEKVEAPIKKGQVVGKLYFKIDGEDIHEVPLVALNDMEEGGFFSKLGDWFGLKVDSWF